MGSMCLWGEICPIAAMTTLFRFCWLVRLTSAPVTSSLSKRDTSISRHYCCLSHHNVIDLFCEVKCLGLGPFTPSTVKYAQLIPFSAPANFSGLPVAMPCAVGEGNVMSYKIIREGGLQYRGSDKVNMFFCVSYRILVAVFREGQKARGVKRGRWKAEYAARANPTSTKVDEARGKGFENSYWTFDDRSKSKGIRP